MLSHEHPRAAARRVETDDPDDLGPVSSTPELMVTRALEFADVTPEDVVYDLGCNDGRVCVAAARERRSRWGWRLTRACAVARTRGERCVGWIDSSGARRETARRPSQPAEAKEERVRVELASAFDVDVETSRGFRVFIAQGKREIGREIVTRIKTARAWCVHI